MGVGNQRRNDSCDVGIINLWEVVVGGMEILVWQNSSREIKNLRLLCGVRVGMWESEVRRFLQGNWQFEERWIALEVISGLAAVLGLSF